MKYILTESQIENLVFQYLNNFDWKIWDGFYENATRLYKKNADVLSDDYMFEAHDETDYDDDDEEIGTTRFLVVNSQLWKTVRLLFGIPHSEIGHLFLKWFNHFTNDNCVDVDVRD